MGLSCGSCGTQLSATAKFCSECGSPLAEATRSAEYKQVTVLFADVVHSMDIAAAVGPERLREIMAELVDHAAGVVKRYGGTVDKFTGDGIMAVFGAPIAYEDHGARACLAAMGIQEQMAQIAAGVASRDGIDLRLRIGLNSGQVIAGDIGSTSLGYTTIGEHVGLAQRMQSVAPPAGVMLSDSTARIVADVATLAEPEMAYIKGATEPVPAHRLLAMTEHHEIAGRHASTLVGREWEVGALTGMLHRAVDGHGCLVGLVGPAGIGKSRLVAETASTARSLGVEVFSAFCESHAAEVPFRAIAALLRTAFGIKELDAESARNRIRDRVPAVDPEDLLLLDDLLGIRDHGQDVPEIAADARRRRLTNLINAAYLGRSTPAVYVIEDVHWIDPVSESMLADFLSVVARTHSLVLSTYRPEYRGALSQIPGGQTIFLAPLDDSQTVSLVTELLGVRPSVAGLVAQIAQRAAGNPFFAESIVRDLADRHVLAGTRGEYVCTQDHADVTVPATLQAAIAARIDRLDAKAKHTLNAAAVIGVRFDEDLLSELADLDPLRRLIDAELVDQVAFAPRAEFGFRHPLIRWVAYESQLKVDLAALHRRLADAITARASLDDANAALIAEHLQGAGDLGAAYEWHMRAGAWLASRDIAGACLSWERARQVADTIAAGDPDALAMQIAPRTLWCANAWRLHAGVAGRRFDELQELCDRAGDKTSPAIAMTGLLAEGVVQGRIREASRLAAEHSALIESIADPTLMVGLAVGTIGVRVVTGEIQEVLRWSDTVIDLAHGDPVRGNYVMGSPLAGAYATRSLARWCFLHPGWRDDMERAVELAHSSDPWTRATVMFYTFGAAVAAGVYAVDDAAHHEIDDALMMAEASGDDLAVSFTKYTKGLLLVHGDSADRNRGLELLTEVRELTLASRFYLSELPMVELYAAREHARHGHLDDAIGGMRPALDLLFERGQFAWGVVASAVFVETLLARGGKADLAEAEAVADRMATAPLEMASECRDLWLLLVRTLLQGACGDESAYRDYRDRYRASATALGFEGHMKWAAAMP
ncbi:MAG TPA: adenylate/guanylate cyclase domain-containing protein [Mycobacterium sp.]|nr:adenylate/guanylate cyclase domain-containing protein [Mycobacterium sp.]